MEDTIDQEIIFKRRRNAMMVEAAIFPILAFIVFYGGVTILGFLIFGATPIILSVLFTFLFLNTRKNSIPDWKMTKMILAPFIISGLTTIVISIIIFVISFIHALTH